MKLALLKGNRFNPWHLRAFSQLRGNPSITAFRAESEVQGYFHGRDDHSLPFSFERIRYDTEVGNPITRLVKVVMERYNGREPRIAPFRDRLAGFDLLQSWELFTDWTAEAVAAKRKNGTPLVLMVWDNIPFNMEQNPRRRQFKQDAVEAADLFLVHTDRSRRVLDMEGVPPERVALIHPGVDAEQFSPGAKERAKFAIDDDEFVILFVGWLLPRKGLDFLILALRELTKDTALSGRRLRLMIVGAGPGKERVERLIGRTGVGSNCTFVEPMAYDLMPEVFRAADVFALPSIAMPEWQEQFGMSLIEAMASGIPVISTYSGAIPEIAGDAALLCQPNDFVSFYETIKDLIMNPSRRGEYGAAGRERVLERFTLHGYAEALSDVYESLLSDS